MFGLGNLGGIMKAANALIGKFKLDPSEKEEFKLKMEQLLQERDTEIESTIRRELTAKERIMVAELTQGSTYTKAARPSVVYFGLFIIFTNYTLIPFLLWALGSAPRVFDLPAEFWLAWGGIVSTWTIGRTAERWGGYRNRAVMAITGNQVPKSRLLDE